MSGPRVTTNGTISDDLRASLALHAGEPRRLVAKLAEVMQAVDRIKKRGHNAFHNYDYATEADIVEAVRHEMASRFLMLIPEVVHLATQELGPNKKGDPRDPLTVLTMRFTFMDGETGESISRQWFGVGQDGGDKGVYKAMTGAEKYFLMKTFLIPTGDDPEQDSKDDKGAVKEREAATVKPTAATKRTRPALTDGAVYLEKVTPKTRGGMDYAEIVTSTGEVLFAREHGCIALAMELAQEGAAVMLTTRRNGKGNTEIDEMRRWPPREVEAPTAPQPQGAAF